MTNKESKALLNIATTALMGLSKHLSESLHGVESKVMEEDLLEYKSLVNGCERLSSLLKNEFAIDLVSGVTQASDFDRALDSASTLMNKYGF